MKSEIRSLTGIRGVAALWVMGFHIMGWMDNPLTPNWFFGNGFIAVDIFFLLSGFIMMHVHAGMLPARWPGFFARRIFRIYPLHVALMALLAVKVLASHQNPVAAEYFSWRSFPYVLTLTSLDFGFTADHWNAPTWSLDVEMVCYLAFPLAALLLPRLPRPAAWGGLIVMLVLSCLSLTNFADGTCFAPFEGIGAFERGAAEFFAGAVLYQAISGLSGYRPWIECVAAAALIAAIASPYPMVSPMFAIALIGALSYDKGPVARILASKPLWWTGQVSLSLYLVHTPICHILEHLKPVLARHVGEGIAGSVTVVAMYVVSLAVSAVTYRLLEKPGQRLGKRLLARLDDARVQRTVNPALAPVSPIEIAPNAS